MKYTCLKAEDIEVILPALPVYHNTPQRYLIKVFRTIGLGCQKIIDSFKL
jgi:hypothetical protein